MNSSFKHSEQELSNISEQLIEARATGGSFSRFPGELPQTLETAYRIQDLSISKWSDQLVGWKVGGIPENLQKKFQEKWLSGPIYGKSIQHSDGKRVVEMPIFENGYAAIEAEFIIQLGDVSELPDVGITENQLIDAIDKVFIGVEIASSPIQNINDLGPTAPISDFGNNAGLLIGPEFKNWREIELSSIAVTATIDGETFGPTMTKPNLDGPIGATKFLIEQLKHRGHEIGVGTFVSTGAITGVHHSNVGTQSKVSFDGVGELDLRLVSNISR